MIQKTYFCTLGEVNMEVLNLKQCPSVIKQCFFFISSKDAGHIFRHSDNYCLELDSVSNSSWLQIFSYVMDELCGKTKSNLNRCHGKHIIRCPADER